MKIENTTKPNEIKIVDVTFDDFDVQDNEVFNFPVDFMSSHVLSKKDRNFENYINEFIKKYGNEGSFILKEVNKYGNTYFYDYNVKGNDNFSNELKNGSNSMNAWIQSGGSLD
jgi:hypothetical protein